ncbi:MAG: hypothetical protein WAU31_02125 [Candidatus Moraniibacteriota bacterium]
MFNNKPFVCTVCGYTGKPKTIIKGNFIIEVILWFFFLIPGIIYSIWRMSSKYTACPKCKNSSMIPSDSPVGMKLMDEHQVQTSIQTDQAPTPPVPIQKTEEKRGLKIALTIMTLILFMIIVGVIDSIINSNTPPTSTTVATTTPAAPAKEVKNVFDIPSLLGKNVDGIKKVLGTPTIDTEPTKKQLSMGITDWEKSYNKDGENLLVSYDAKTRKVKDFFVSGTDRNDLLIIGGVKEDAQNYTVSFVKAIVDSTKITGMTVSAK